MACGQSRSVPTQCVHLSQCSSEAPLACWPRSHPACSTYDQALQPERRHKMFIELLSTAIICVAIIFFAILEAKQDKQDKQDKN